MHSIRAIDIRLLGKKRTGDEAVFFNLTKGVLALDKTNDYLLLTDETDPEKISLLESQLFSSGQKNTRIVSLFGKNRFVWNLISVPWFLFTRNIDLYHTQYILPLFVPKRTKVVTHIHDVSFRAYPKLIGFLDRFFLSVFIPRSLQRTDCIVAPSQFTKDEIIRYYRIAPEKIAVIPNALGGEFLAEDVKTRAELDRKYHLRGEFILYVGTLQPRKNIPFLIRAFQKLREQLPGLSLVLVGNRLAHHVDPAIDQVIKELDLETHVYFPGYVDSEDLPSLMALASVFVCPSLYEGFGIPLLEAMSQGVPVAASHIPSQREVGGDAPLYFDPSNLASCQEKLYNLVTDKNARERAISLGKSRLSLFSWEKSSTLLYGVYEAVS